MLTAVLLAGCAAPQPDAAPPAVLIFGEAHDQPDQQRQVADTVSALAREGRLAAVVLEMAERGRDTRGLPRDADAARVREALAWTGWPWDAYAAVVLRAVQAGVPVLGGNAPRSGHRAAMADTTLDATLPAAARDKLAEAVRTGHCGLLPASQEPGMVRIQIARDRAMAATVQAALQQARPGQQVLLLTGAQHAARDRGVPLHLAPGTPLRVVMFGGGAATLPADEQRPAQATPRPDPCEALRQRMQGRPAG
ncbi:ChaN family lipoprotein [Rubrivivax sp. RP6-9]|uniref:ChaN family lipoprotein n=1 Tax=Rubrivivax sp. RP6-9 TaxID=3415750 RepID=UPI003CC5BC4E